MRLIEMRRGFAVADLVIIGDVLFLAVGTVNVLLEAVEDLLALELLSGGHEALSLISIPFHRSEDMYYLRSEGSTPRRRGQHR